MFGEKYDLQEPQVPEDMGSADSTILTRSSGNDESSAKRSTTG